MTQTDKVLVRKDQGIGHLIFNNTERHNALSLDMWEAAGSILDDFIGDDSVRVIVLSGAGGKAFVAGADISRFDDERANVAAIDAYNAVVDRTTTTLYESLKPTIAQIEGYCLGGGVALAICCDLRICSANSRFAVPAAKLGLGYVYPGLKKLIDLIGPAFAKEVFFTARQFTAEEALMMGLVNRVLPASDLETYVRDYAGMIAANAPLTVKAAKYAINQAVKDESQRDLARCDELVRACFVSNDYVEGRRAFMEKRKPEFTGT